MAAHINEILGGFLLNKNIPFIPKEVPRKPEDLTNELFDSVFRVIQGELLSLDSRENLDLLLERLIFPICVADEGLVGLIGKLTNMILTNRVHFELRN